MLMQAFMADVIDTVRMDGLPATACVTSSTSVSTDNGRSMRQLCGVVSRIQQCKTSAS